MKESDIIGVIQSGFLRIALRQIAKTYSPNCTLSFQTNLIACESGTICPRFIIIESVLIPDPMELTLAQMKSKNPDGRIFIIENKQCTNNITPYIYDIAKQSDSEESLNERLKSFLSVNDNELNNSNDVISDREKEIVKLVALGKTNKEISDCLFISPHTVITHRKNITSKLGIKTIAGLTVYAVLNGIINPDEV